MKRWPKPATWLVVLVVFVWAAHGAELYKFNLRSLRNTFDFVYHMFPPDWGVIPSLGGPIVLTLQIALLGTWLAFLLAFPLAFLAARNVSPGAWLYLGVRNLLSFFRAVPSIMWALLLVAAFGTGPLPGVLALAIHNAGLLGKVLSELMEAAEPGPQEAVAAAGGPRSMVVWYGILPQTVPNMLSYTFYRFECSVRDAAVLGFVGAGGIGTVLWDDFRLFQYDRVIVQVLAVLLLVIAVDYAGAYIRRRVI